MTATCNSAHVDDISRRGDRTARVRRLALLLDRAWPEALSDVDALLTPPDVDQFARAAGFGPYRGDQLKMVRHLLTRTLGVSAGELRDALDEARSSR